MHNHTGYICLAFLHCVFLNAPSKLSDKKLQTHTGCICSNSCLLGMYLSQSEVLLYAHRFCPHHHQQDFDPSLQDETSESWERDECLILALRMSPGYWFFWIKIEYFERKRKLKYISLCYVMGHTFYTGIKLLFNIRRSIPIVKGMHIIGCLWLPNEINCPWFRYTPWKCLPRKNWKTWWAWSSSPHRTWWSSPWRGWSSPPGGSCWPCTAPCC